MGAIGATGLWTTPNADRSGTDPLRKWPLLGPGAELNPAPSAGAGLNPLLGVGLKGEPIGEPGGRPFDGGPMAAGRPTPRKESKLGYGRGGGTL